jgi:hypothetical protein
MKCDLIFILLVWFLGVQIVWILLWLLAVYGLATNSTETMIKGYNLSSCTTYSYYTNLLLPISPLNPEDEATFSLDCSSSDHQNMEECYACMCFNDVSDTNEMVSTSKACITSQVNTTTLLLLLLSFFWTSSAIANIVHCTTAGSVGTWWFRFIYQNYQIYLLYFLVNQFLYLPTIFHHLMNQI